MSSVDPLDFFVQHDDRSFTTCLLEPPVVVGPPPNTRYDIAVTDQATISWEPDPLADFYILQLSFSGSFDGSTTEGIKQTTTEHTLTLSDWGIDTPIYWRVFAYSDDTSICSSPHSLIGSVEFFNSEFDSPGNSAGCDDINIRDLRIVEPSESTEDRIIEYISDEEGFPDVKIKFQYSLPAGVGSLSINWDIVDYGPFAIGTFIFEPVAGTSKAIILKPVTMDAVQISGSIVVKLTIRDDDATEGSSGDGVSCEKELEVSYLYIDSSSSSQSGSSSQSSSSESSLSSSSLSSLSSSSSSSSDLSSQSSSSSSSVEQSDDFNCDGAVLFTTPEDEPCTDITPEADITFINGLAYVCDGSNCCLVPESSEYPWLYMQISWDESLPYNYVTWAGCRVLNGQIILVCADTFIYCSQAVPTDPGLPTLRHDQFDLLEDDETYIYETDHMWSKANGITLQVTGETNVPRLGSDGVPFGFYKTDRIVTLVPAVDDQGGSEPAVSDFHTWEENVETGAIIGGVDVVSSEINILDPETPGQITPEVWELEIDCRHLRDINDNLIPQCPPTKHVDQRGIRYEWWKDRNAPVANQSQHFPGDYTCDVGLITCCDNAVAGPTMIFTLNWPEGLQDTIEWAGCTWERGDTKEVCPDNYIKSTDPVTLNTEHYWRKGDLPQFGANFSIRYYSDSNTVDGQPLYRYNFVRQLGLKATTSFDQFGKPFIQDYLRGHVHYVTARLTGSSGANEGCENEDETDFVTGSVNTYQGFVTISFGCTGYSVLIYFDDGFNTVSIRRSTDILTEVARINYGATGTFALDEGVSIIITNWEVQEDIFVNPLGHLTPMTDIEDVSTNLDPWIDSHDASKEALYGTHTDTFGCTYTWIPGPGWD